MSMLTIIRAAQRRLGLAVASTVAGNTDDTATQLLALLNQAGEELAEDYTWQALIREAIFTTSAAEDQGAITTIAPTNFHYILNDTFWNRSNSRPVNGPLTTEQWQRQQASNVTGPHDQFRIRGNRLLMLPTPTAGQTCAFEYATKNWATDSTGATGKEAFTADDDLAVLDEQLLTLSLIWRFKQANGLDWAAELQMYEDRVANAKARDGGKPRIRLDGATVMGLGFPEGSFAQ